MGAYMTFESEVDCSFRNDSCLTRMSHIVKSGIVSETGIVHSSIGFSSIHVVFDSRKWSPHVALGRFLFR